MEILHSKNGKHDKYFYIFFIFIALLFLVLRMYEEYSFSKRGVYTIGKVTNWESAEQGSSCFVDVYYHGKIYKTVLNTTRPQVGRFYYVSLLANDPGSAGILKEEVQPCILEKPIPYEGWKKIPSCN